MKTSADIRQLYKPIQPTGKQSDDKVTYSEFLPDIRLQNYIYCYWQLKTTETLSEPFIYRVVADGCIDIFFELNNPKDNFVMGFCKKFTEFPLDNSFHYIGVRFLPTMFPQLFRINASELSNRFEQLCNVVPKVSTFIADNFNHQLTPEQAQKTFDSYFISLIENTTFDNDSRLYNAIEKILQEFEVLDIEQDLNTGISQRQLRRLFEF